MTTQLNSMPISVLIVRTIYVIRSSILIHYYYNNDIVHFQCKIGPPVQVIPSDFDDSAYPWSLIGESCCLSNLFPFPFSIPISIQFDPVRSRSIALIFTDSQHWTSIGYRRGARGVESSRQQLLLLLLFWDFEHTHTRTELWFASLLFEFDSRSRFDSRSKFDFEFDSGNEFHFSLRFPAWFLMCACVCVCGCQSVS